MLLFKLEKTTLPEKASDAHIQRLYSQRASAWDQGVTAENQYQGHKLVADALNKWVSEDGINILDAGCGTGLVGPLVRNKATILEGVDISAPMLAQAKEKKVYNHLYHEDLITFMNERPSRYDAITSAATLIHFGDLRAIFETIARSLKPGGIFTATLFPNEDDIDSFSIASINGLAQGGCYMHGQNYIEETSSLCGLSVKEIDIKVHEYRKGSPIMAHVLVLRKNP